MVWGGGHWHVQLIVHAIGKESSDCLKNGFFLKSCERVRVKQVMRETNISIDNEIRKRILMQLWDRRIASARQVREQGVSCVTHNTRVT